MTDPNSPHRSQFQPDALSARPAGSTATLTPEALAAYIDGRLTAVERRAVEAHVSADPEAYAWLAEAVAIARALPPDAEERAEDVRPERGRRPWWTFAFAGLATAAALLMLVRGTTAPSSSPDELLARLAADAGTPSFQPWLSGGFGVSSQGTMRGGGDARPATALLARVVDLERAAASAPSAAADHALGVALLVAGGAGRADAVARLQAAADADGRPAYLTDLAAAYLERAIRTGTAGDAERALALTARALDVAPALPEALYNRALALQTLERRDDALAAWSAFLAMPEGPGHGPAREHLARLREHPGATTIR